MSSVYTNDHVSQYAPGCSPATRRGGCTWTTGRNGADAATGGAVDKTPDQIKALVKKAEETNPASPGWSLSDLSLAMSRLDVQFGIRSGRGWDAVRVARGVGLYVAVQGDSDQFGNATCSGSFDGDHMIGIHPDNDAAGRWRIDDPICKTARYETESVLRSYAQKLASSVLFGAFLDPVPVSNKPPDTGTEGPMIPVGLDAGYLVDLKAGVELLDEDYKPLVKVSVPQTAHGYFYSQPAGGTNCIAIEIVTGGVHRLAFVRAKDVPTPKPRFRDGDYAERLRRIQQLSNI